MAQCSCGKDAGSPSKDAAHAQHHAPIQSFPIMPMPMFLPPQPYFFFAPGAAASQEHGFWAPQQHGFYPPAFSQPAQSTRPRRQGDGDDEEASRPRDENPHSDVVAVKKKQQPRPAAPQKTVYTYDHAYAATKIQKVFRGRRARCTLVPRLIAERMDNELAEYAIAAGIMDEVLEDSVLPDVFCELCQEEYLPFGRTFGMKAHRIKYNLVDEVVGEMIDRALFECRDEIISEYLETAGRRMNPAEYTMNMVLDDVLAEHVRLGVESELRAEAWRLVRDQVADKIFEALVGEQVEESGVITNVLADDTAADLCETILEAAVAEIVRALCVSIRFVDNVPSIKKQSALARRSTSRSETVDKMMEYLVAHIVLDSRYAAAEEDNIVDEFLATVYLGDVFAPALRREAAAGSASLPRAGAIKLAAE